MTALLNGCRVCGKDFAGVGGFDKHRVGRHEFTYAEGARMDPPRDDGRRCLDTEEMLADGFELDPRGRWRRAGEAERARASFARSAGNRATGAPTAPPTPKTSPAPIAAQGAVSAVTTGRKPPPPPERAWWLDKSGPDMWWQGSLTSGRGRRGAR